MGGDFGGDDKSQEWARSLFPRKILSDVYVFSIFLFRLCSSKKISFGEKRSENNKKNENWTWQVGWKEARVPPIKSHTTFYRPPTLKHANPKNRYSVGRRENWIFRLSKPHKTRQRSFSVALFHPSKRSHCEPFLHTVARWVWALEVVAKWELDNVRERNGECGGIWHATLKRCWHGEEAFAQSNQSFLWNELKIFFNAKLSLVEWVRLLQYFSWI